MKKPKLGTTGATLTWERVCYCLTPEGFTERTYGKVYGLSFHYKGIKTTLQTICNMGEKRRRSPRVLTLSTTVFILCIYFQAWSVHMGFPLDAVISCTAFSNLPPSFHTRYPNVPSVLIVFTVLLDTDYREILEKRFCTM